MLSNHHDCPERDQTNLDAAILPDLRQRLTSLKTQNHSPEQFEALLSRALSIAESKRGVIRIGMYDGSFDPPHYGHVETAYAAAQIARLDVLVINCHPEPNSLKPYLTSHSLRNEMLRSYFPGDPMIIVSPLSRSEITDIVKPHRVVGIIGSDTFNRFLVDGIASDFLTDEIFVAERQEHPLPQAPVSLDGRRVWYTGRHQLAHNYGCSTSIRSSLANASDKSLYLMINEETQRIAHDNALYKASTPPNPIVGKPPPASRVAPSFHVPEPFRGCKVVQRVGLENGLLSESFIFEVRNSIGDPVAYMKMLPPERDPSTMLPDEAAGLAFCNSLRIPGVSAPEAYLYNEPPSLWVHKAPGETIGSIITKYDREMVSAQQVYDALYAVGNFLRQLHVQHPLPFDAQAKDLLEVYIEHHEEVLRQADPLEAHDRSVQAAVEVFRTESLHLRKSGLTCALLHGDANCGNFLWDHETRHLSVIDLQRLGTQRRLQAPGFAAFEYRCFLNVLGFYPNIGFRGRRGGLHDACKAFEAGYGDVNQHEDNFFTSIRYIRRALAGNERVHQIKRPAVPL